MLFQQFWSLYPKKVGKAKALLRWNKLMLDSSITVPLILSALKQQITSVEWTKEGGQYVPHATTWLNGFRWEDRLTYKKDWRDG